MGKKLQFAIIALLGFSTACSSAKKTEQTPQNEDLQQPVKAEPRIRVMYGTRSPYPVTVIEEPQIRAEHNDSDNSPQPENQTDQNPDKTE